MSARWPEISGSGSSPTRRLRGGGKRLGRPRVLGDRLGPGGVRAGAGEESFFFFKQKTAFERRVGLEFRRVLFRSHLVGGDRGGAVGNPTAAAAAHREGQGRSEERRVGKEGRSRWAPYH